MLVLLAVAFVEVVEEVIELVEVDEMVEEMTDVESADEGMLEALLLEDLVVVLNVEGVAVEEDAKDELEVLEVEEATTLEEDDEAFEAEEDEELEGTTLCGTSLAPQTVGELTAGPTVFFM